MVNRHSIYPPYMERSEMRLPLKSKHSAVHEAIFEVFTGWPNYGLIELPALGADAEVKRNRPFFFMPTSDAIDFELFGEKFRMLYLGLRTAIDAGWLEGTFQKVCDRKIYVVSLWDVIVWALRGDLPIRKGVQNALKIHQNTQRPLHSQLETVGDAIKAQYVFMQSGDNLVDPVCKLIRGRRDTTTLKEYLNANFFDKPGKRGRPSNSPGGKKNGRQYIHKVLDNVCVIQSNGVMKYQFSLLEKVFSTIANEILAPIDSASIREMSVDDFLEKLGSDPVATLYLKNAPEVILHFVCSIAEEIFFSVQDSLTPKLSEQFEALPFSHKQVEK